MKSGISEYSEVLIQGLNEHFDITLLIDGYKIKNKKMLNELGIKIFNKKTNNINRFDFRIYNIGNNPQYHAYIYEAAIKYPGMITLVIGNKITTKDKAPTEVNQHVFDWIETKMTELEGQKPVKKQSQKDDN